MALNLAAYTGTEAIAVAAEHSLTTDTAGPDVTTAAGVYQAVLDLSDMVDGDVVEFNVYEKARSGDTQRKVDSFILRDVQEPPCVATREYMLGIGWDMTVKVIAGAASGPVTVLWGIRSVS